MVKFLSTAYARYQEEFFIPNTLLVIPNTLLVIPNEREESRSFDCAQDDKAQSGSVFPSFFPPPGQRRRPSCFEGQKGFYCVDMEVPIGAHTWEAALASAHCAWMGFDTYIHDLIGTFQVTTDGFCEIGRCIRALDRPTLVVQEGGYHVHDLGKNVIALLSALIGQS